MDEMGSNTSLHELYAYSPRGERAYCSVARNRGKNTTLLSSMSLSGMGPSMVVEGGANGAVFEGYLREMLLPALGEEDVVVMDNLSVHKSERVREMIEGVGAADPLPAALLAGLQPDRGGVQQDQESDKESGCAGAGGSRGGDWGGAL